MLCHCLSFDSHWPLVKFLVNKGPLFKEFEKPHHDFIYQVKLKLNHLTTIFWGKGCWCNLFFEHKHLSIVHWLSVKTQFDTFVHLFIVQYWYCTVISTPFSYPFNVCAKMQVVLVLILYITTFASYQKGKIIFAHGMNEIVLFWWYPWHEKLAHLNVLTIFIVWYINYMTNFEIS